MIFGKQVRWSEQQLRVSPATSSRPLVQRRRLPRTDDVQVQQLETERRGSPALCPRINQSGPVGRGTLGPHGGLQERLRPGPGAVGSNPGRLLNTTNTPVVLLEVPSPKGNTSFPSEPLLTYFNLDWRLIRRISTNSWPARLCQQHFRFFRAPQATLSAPMWHHH